MIPARVLRHQRTNNVPRCMIEILAKATPIVNGKKYLRLRVAMDTVG